MSPRPVCTPILAAVTAALAFSAPAPVTAQGIDEVPVTTVVARADGTVLDSARAALRATARAGVGIGVAVIRAGEAVWVEGIGWADRQAGIAVDPTGTRFRIYSVAKPMTAVAAARLMERGALDPSAPVRSYVPAFPAHAAPITAMQLATHRSGIRHYADTSEANSTRHCEAVADALPIFADDPLVHEPGEAESYSSWGYVLLSAVVAATADTGFVPAMERLVFDPAAMQQIVLDDPTVSIPGRATFYREHDGAIEPAPVVDNTCKWGAGGFVASPYDVARFGAAMLDDTLLAPRSLSLFFRGSDVYRAQGVGTGGAAFLVVDRSNDLVVALAVNTVGERAGPAARHAFNAIHRLFAAR